MTQCGNCGDCDECEYNGFDAVLVRCVGCRQRFRVSILEHGGYCDDCTARYLRAASSPTLIAYRVTTRDLRPPVRGGDPVPHVPGERLPLVRVDTSPDEECGAGWAACVQPHDALRIAGLWPDGRPSRMWRVASVNGHEVFERDDKLRAATWRVVEEVPITNAILADLHRPMAGDGLAIDDLVAEVQAWRAALARPAYDEAAAEAALRAALDRRGLGGWALRRFASAWDAWAAWAAWDARRADRDARDARDAWNARDARVAWDARADRDARDARVARDAWDARDARDLTAAAAAAAARAALTVFVAARRGWWRSPAAADLLTVGHRDAYASGLAEAIPTGPNEIGWSMIGDACADDYIRAASSPTLPEAQRPTASPAVDARTSAGPEKPAGEASPSPEDSR